MRKVLIVASCSENVKKKEQYRERKKSLKQVNLS